MANISAAGPVFSELGGALQKIEAGNDAEGSRREALRLMRLLTSALEKPEDVAFELGLMPSYAFACRVAGKLGLFSALTADGDSKTVSQLATATRAEPLLLVRILRVLAAQGAVKEIGKDEYKALPVTHILAAPAMVAIHRHFWDQGVACMAKFPDWLDENGAKCPSEPTDGLFQYAFDTKLEAFAYWQTKPEILDNVNTLMEGVRSGRPDWVDWFPVQERILEGYEQGDDDDSRLLVDVGGGRGHQLVAFQRRFPQPKGRLVLEDLLPVIEDVKTIPEEITLQPYDFFTPQVVKGIDRTLFHAVLRLIFIQEHECTTSAILHDWSDGPCLDILQNTASAMKKGYSKLLINDLILPDTGCSLFQAGFDMNMMAIHAGIERSRSQWKELLMKAGFKDVSFWNPPGDSEGVVEASI